MLRSRIWAARDRIFKGILDKLLIVFYMDIWIYTRLHIYQQTFLRDRYWIQSSQKWLLIVQFFFFFKGDFYDPLFKKYLRLFDQWLSHTVLAIISVVTIRQSVAIYLSTVLGGTISWNVGLFLLTWNSHYLLVGITLNGLSFWKEVWYRKTHKMLVPRLQTGKSLAPQMLKDK